MHSLCIYLARLAELCLLLLSGRGGEEGISLQGGSGGGNLARAFRRVALLPGDFAAGLAKEASPSGPVNRSRRAERQGRDGSEAKRASFAFACRRGGPAGVSPQPSEAGCPWVQESAALLGGVPPVVATRCRVVPCCCGGGDPETLRRGGKSSCSTCKRGQGEEDALHCQAGGIPAFS